MQPTTTSAQGSITTSPTHSNPVGSHGTDSAAFNTAQGQITINSTLDSTPSTASPPSFGQLANGKAYISKENANAFPPLANLFDHASRHGNRISKAQYERWLKSLN